MYIANYEDMALDYPYKNTKKDFFFSQAKDHLREIYRVVKDQGMHN